MDIRQIRKIYSIIVISGCCCVALAPILGNLLWKNLYWILICSGIAFSLIGIVYAFKKYRCPYCDEILPMREAMPHFCPGCGAKLW